MCIIKTQNGYLDPLKPEHAAELFDLLHASRKQLHPWLPWMVNIHSHEDAKAFIEKLLRDTGPQFVVRLEDHTLCGGLGFYIMEDRARRATIGFWLGEGFTGQGIMTDAVASACDYAFAEDQGFQVLEIRIAANNKRGRRVPERCGFTLDGVIPRAAWLTDTYVDHACYRLTRQTYLTR